MYVCVYVCIHVRLYVCMCVHLCICMCVCVCVWVFWHSVTWTALYGSQSKKAKHSLSLSKCRIPDYG